MKFLIIKTSALGDIIHVFPAVQYLKDRYPLAEIDWVVEAPFADLVKSHPAITQVISVHTRLWRRSLFSRSTWKEIRNYSNSLQKKNYDAIFDLQGNLKSALLLSRARGKVKVGFGLKNVSEWPNLFFTNKKFNPPEGLNIRDDYLCLVKSYFKDKSDFHEKGIELRISENEKQLIGEILEKSKSSNKVLVCPGAAWVNKQIKAQTWLQVLKEIQNKRQSDFLFLWGTQEEKTFAEKLSTHFPHNGFVVERLSLPALQNLMGCVNLVIAMDSLPLHLCGTTNTSTLSFFGPSLAAKYRPKGDQHTSFQGNCPYGIVFKKRCPKLRTCSTGFCLKQIDQEALDSFIEEKT